MTTLDYIAKQTSRMHELAHASGRMIDGSSFRIIGFYKRRPYSITRAEQVELESLRREIAVLDPIGVV